MTSDVVERLEAAAALKHLRATLRTRGGRTLVGIDGVDGSGKTSFADDLADLLREGGLEVIRISLDDYLNPQHVRYAQGRGSAKGYFEDSYDYERIIDEVLEPLGRDGSGRFRTACYSLEDEAPVKSPWKVAPDHCVVIIDGMFMHRDEFCASRKKKVWDLSVWLEVPFQECYKRKAERDGTSADPDDPANARYYQGQLLYLQRCDPAQRADIVADNTLRHEPVD